jgi:hypothetical protein
MGEEVAGLPEALAVGAETGLEPEPIGAYLSRQRRLRGVSLDELARVTCIPLRSLARLESGAFDAAPDGFARGFVRTVAVALGLDPDDTVGRMLPEARLGARRTQPLSEPGNSRWLLLTVLVLTSVAFWWIEHVGGGPAGPADPRAQQVLRRDAVRELAREHGLLPPAEDATALRSERAARAP